MWMKFAYYRGARVMLLVLVMPITSVAEEPPGAWLEEWPRTHFAQAAIPFSDVTSGGPPRDGIAALDHPRFMAAGEIEDIGALEPVIVISAQEIVKAYPVRILMWHEIVNDTLADTLIAVTYCPLCNAGIVFDRSFNRAGERLAPTFGVSGKLRHSDMIMYDRATELWWQQFTGEAVVGEMTGTALTKLASETLPFGEFRNRYPDGLVLVPTGVAARRYGINPYVRYDGSAWPFLYRGEYDDELAPLAYVVSIGARAWPLARLRQAGEIVDDGLILRWSPGMNSALDNERIADGRDIGYAAVARLHDDGSRSVVQHEITFAFVFKAFYPDAVISSE